VERHQTLRAAVDWSYGLLSETERVVFDRLAVFSGGFTLAPASAVVTGDGIEGWDIVDAVGALVAKSIAVAEPDAGEHTRYQLLETLRQYGRERLDEHGDTNGWRRRHAGHFAAFAAEVARGLRGRDELAWRERLLDDLDNLRSAVVWGLDTGVEEDQQTAVAIVAWLAYEAQSRETASVGGPSRPSPQPSGPRPGIAAPCSPPPAPPPSTGVTSTRRSATPGRPSMRVTRPTTPRPARPRPSWPASS
jgi:predicted ATPase